MSDVLPGADLVEKGVADLANGRLTVEALLVAIGAERLRGLGVPVVARENLPTEPEHRLYAKILEENPRDAHSQYNAVVRRLVSFEHALEQRLGRQRRRAPVA